MTKQMDKGFGQSLAENLQSKSFLKDCKTLRQKAVDSLDASLSSAQTCKIVELISQLNDTIRCLESTFFYDSKMNHTGGRPKSTKNGAR